MAVPVAAASFGQDLGQSAASTGTNGLINGFLGQLFGGMNAAAVEISAEANEASAEVRPRADAEAV